jgi:hypothetical protein
VQPHDRRFRVRVNVKLKPGGKADCTQHAQVILTKPPLGFANRPNDFVLHIGLATHEVLNVSGLRVEQERVNREVATRDIQLDIGFEMHLGRPPAITISTVTSVRGYLDVNTFPMY